MADPKPVSQQVKEETTTDENKVNSSQSNGWFTSLPAPVQGVFRTLGLENNFEAAAKWVDENQDNPLISGVLDIISDNWQRFRDVKDNLLGPEQISFTVATKAKLGDNDRNDAHKSSLRYPSDAKLEETEYMLFQFYRYEAPLGRGGSGSLNLARTITGQDSGEFDSVEEYNLATTNLSVDTQLNQVVLYMPPDVSSTYGAEWSDQSFSNTAVAKIRGGMALRRAEVGKALAGQLSNLGNAVTRMPEISGADFIRDQIASATGEQLSRNDLFSSSAGVILNPNTELLYRNPHMRTIDFTFKLIPNNKEEAEIIFEIVRTFKLCLHPTFGIPGRQQGGKAQKGGVLNTFGDATTKVGFITVPSVCKFAFMKGGDLHPYLPQYKTCALTGVDVNYTTDGQYVVTRDGYPVATELRLSFKELKLVYREDIRPVTSSTIKIGQNKSLHGGH